MSFYVLVPGAGGDAWYWHRLIPELAARGHQATAVDLPGPDPAAGLPEYTSAVLSAVDGHRDAILVAQSLGGFTAPMVCDRTDVGRLVLVNPMIPLPGETAGDWWGNTGVAEARITTAAEHGYPEAFDVTTYFLHDVPAETLADGAEHDRPEADIVFGQPCDVPHWPHVRTGVVAGRDDRFFPVDFQRRVARQRLGIEIDVLPGGHLLALANPSGLAHYLVRDAGPADEALLQVGW